MYDALIVGGGAAGLAAACALAEPERLRVAVLEKQPRVGRKLLSTGNGRCNLTNVAAAAENYHGARGAAARALELCPPAEALAFFERLGVPAVVDGEGRAYPMSNQAASVLDALRLYAAERGCEFLVGCAAESVEPSGRAAPGRPGFVVRTADGRALRARRVIVCTGGLAAPKLGACGDGYRLLERLGHRSGEKRPAIAPLKTPPDAVRGLKGLRAAGSIALWVDGRAARVERGEILFAESGISGIAAMQLARACGEALAGGRRCEARLNLLDGWPRAAGFGAEWAGAGPRPPRACENAAPARDRGGPRRRPGGSAAPSAEWALSMLRERAARLPRRAAEDFLSGVVPKRIGQAVARAAGVGPMTRPAGSLTGAELRALASALTEWTIPIAGVQGFDQAQVTAGGVSLDGFDWDTLESRRAPGLYAAGEVLDVDGDCGGFNLQWAWASALIAARDILRRS